MKYWRYFIQNIKLVPFFYYVLVASILFADVMIVIAFLWFFF